MPMQLERSSNLELGIHGYRRIRYVIFLMVKSFVHDLLSAVPGCSIGELERVFYDFATDSPAQLSQPNREYIFLTGR